MHVPDSPTPYAYAAPAAPVRAWERRLLSAVLRWLGAPPVAIGLWNGETLSPARGAQPYGLILHHRAALHRLCRNPGRYLGELYSRGDIEIAGDLYALLCLLYQGFEQAMARHPVLAWLWRERRVQRRHYRSSASRLRHHYDLGEDFFARWLDREHRQYSCAYYPQPGLGLEEAQAAKMHHICRKLRLRAGESVLEAGCGWGGLALFMARHYGVRVTACNLSPAQLDYARARVRRAGLGARIELLEADFRELAGEYDAFVSVGMLEHIGPHHFGALGAVLERCLKPQGRGLIHAIGRNRPWPTNAWIERRIFPGAYPPTLREILAVLEPYAFSVLDVENLRLHYVRTLLQWRERFESQAQDIAAERGEPFLRAWRLYLCGSAAAFSTGWLQLFQVVFHRAHDNDLPWSRGHLYTVGQ